MNYLDKYEGALKFQEVSENTIKAYITDIRLMLDEVGKEPQDITPMDLMDYQMSIQDLADTTKVRKINAIKAFFAWLVDLQVITKNPSVAMKAPKIKDKGVRFTPTDEQIEKMLRLTGNIKLKAIMATLRTTGLRFSELQSIKLHDVTDGKQVITDKVEIIGKGSKPRTVFLDDKSMELINKYLEKRKDGCDALFTSNQGGELENASLNKMIKKVASKCGFDGEGVENHMFRRSFITGLWRKGVSPDVIYALTGHSGKGGFGVECGHYINVTDEDKRMAVK